MKDVVTGLFQYTNRPNIPFEQPLIFVTTNLFNMKLLIISALLLTGIIANAQITPDEIVQQKLTVNSASQRQPVPAATISGKIKVDRSERWKIDRNKILTGGLLFTAGAAKGFNEALQYKYNGFEEIFPKANDQWFYPTFSYKNKYKDGDPEKGPKFPLSTSVLVMFTDQYHLNNFIQKTAMTAALVIKIGEGKKPFRHYVFDVLYYTACYQLGFHTIYQPISMRNK